MGIIRKTEFSTHLREVYGIAFRRTLRSLHIRKGQFIVALAAQPLALLLHWHFRGWEVMLDELYISFIPVAAILVVCLIIFVFHLMTTPFRLLRDARTRYEAVTSPGELDIDIGPDFGIRTIDQIEVPNNTDLITSAIYNSGRMIVFYNVRVTNRTSERVSLWAQLHVDINCETKHIPTFATLNRGNLPSWIIDQALILEGQDPLQDPINLSPSEGSSGYMAFLLHHGQILLAEKEGGEFRDCKPTVLIIEDVISRKRKHFPMESAFGAPRNLLWKEPSSQQGEGDR